MAERERYRPFTGDEARRIRIENPPLAMVLVQVRWPNHSRLERDFTTLALQFGELLTDFPLYEETKEAGFEVTPEGVRPIQATSSTHRWKTIDGIWSIDLNKNVLNVYCTPRGQYAFGDLQERLEESLSLLDSQIGIRIIERVGVRYVDRISDPKAMSQLGQVFDPAALGFGNLATGPGIELVSSVSQAAYKLQDCVVQVRSGGLAPGQTIDNAVAPLDRVSWILDIDASSEHRIPFDSEAIGDKVGMLADAAYDFFKFVLLENGELVLDGAS